MSTSGTITISELGNHRQVDVSVTPVSYRPGGAVVTVTRHGGPASPLHAQARATVTTFHVNTHDLENLRDAFDHTLTVLDPEVSEDVVEQAWEDAAEEALKQEEGEDALWDLTFRVPQLTKAPRHAELEERVERLEAALEAEREFADAQVGLANYLRDVVSRLTEPTEEAA